jgi:hypothetical protein
MNFSYYDTRLEREKERAKKYLKKQDVEGCDPCTQRLGCLLGRPRVSVERARAVPYRDQNQYMLKQW